MWAIFKGQKSIVRNRSKAWIHSQPQVVISRMLTSSMISTGLRSERTMRRLKIWKKKSLQTVKTILHRWKTQLYSRKNERLNSTLLSGVQNSHPKEKENSFPISKSKTAFFELPRLRILTRIIQMKTPCLSQSANPLENSQIENALPLITIKDTAASPAQSPILSLACFSEVPLTLQS